MQQAEYIEKIKVNFTYFHQITTQLTMSSQTFNLDNATFPKLQNK
jgi:hypothetical protein